LRRRGNIIFGLIMVSILAGLAIFIASCCEDCPTCPGPGQPYKGWVYANDYNSDYVYRIDTETDSLVDSVRYEQDLFLPGVSSVSQDGRYLVVPYSDHLNEVYLTRVYDAQTMETIMDIDEPIWPMFVDNGNILIDLGTRTMTFYSVPSFTKIEEDSLFDPDSVGRAMEYVLHEPEHRIYMVVTLEPESGGDSTYIMAYDYEQREVVDKWIVGESGTWHTLRSIDVHPESGRIYLNMEAFGGFNFACYDLEKREILFHYPINTFFGHVKVTPDGEEVYLTDFGPSIGMYPNPGTIYIFSADNGAYLHGISLFGYDPIPYLPLYARRIAFTPTGEKAYVGSGLVGQRSGSVICIDTETREITSLIWPDLGHHILRLTIGPKL
jgi:DNA-binding beta-propeller fold protein YncE